MVDDLLQWNKVKGLSRYHLDALIESRRRAKATLDAAKEAMDVINNKILSALATVDVKSVAVGEVRVTLVAGGKSERLDKKKLWTRLLELDVPEKTVVKAFADSTTTEDKLPYVLVTEPKGEK